MPGDLELTDRQRKVLEVVTAQVNRMVAEAFTPIHQQMDRLNQRVDRRLTVLAGQVAQELDDVEE
jgi:hypothetical protein